MPPEVFITGVGIVSPAGIGAEATFRGLLAGGRYVGLVPSLATDHGQSRGRKGTEKVFLAAKVPGFIPPPDAENVDRVCQLVIAAAEEAIGGRNSDLSALKKAVVSVGTSKGGILSFTNLAPLLTETRHSGQFSACWPGRSVRESLFSIPPDAPARCIADHFGITGGTHATVAACATGTLAIIRAARFIEDGQAELVVCGSADASLHELWFAAFSRMGVLAAVHPEKGPAWACRPFDRNRSGFALGEGAAIMVMETGQSARCRGVQPIARLAGAASATDPAGLVQVGADAQPLARVIALACQRAGYRPADIACIHAHGTATQANDRAEAQAIRMVFGERAATIPVVSLKGAIGHLLGAAGAVETAVATLTCRDGLSPGTATLIEPDPSLGMMNLPRESFGVTGGGPVLKLSSGFGGHVAAIVLVPI